MSSSLATYSLDGTVATLRMDDGKANALSDAMMNELLAGIRRAEEEASALILTGREERFCGGFDLKVMMSGPKQARTLLEKGTDLLMGLYGARVPLVIAATGHAMAGGALLLLTGDVRVGCAGPYKIGLNEVQIGLPVPILAMELARDRLAANELQRATLESKIYDPESAIDSGYLDYVVAKEALFTRALVEATRLGALPKVPYVASKERLRGRTIAYVHATLAEDLQRLMPDA
jgi:enoyl-CoA hydratase